MVVRRCAARHEPGHRQRPKLCGVFTRRTHARVRDSVDLHPRVADIIEQVSLSSRDKGISQDEMKESWYKNLTKAIEGMVQQGVTQKTYTKGGFKVTEQQVGFTEQKAQTAAAQAIATAKPTDVQRQQDISFMDWVFQNAPKDIVGGK